MAETDTSNTTYHMIININGIQVLEKYIGINTLSITNGNFLNILASASSDVDGIDIRIDQIDLTTSVPIIKNTKQDIWNFIIYSDSSVSSDIPINDIIPSWMTRQMYNDLYDSYSDKMVPRN